MTAATQESLRSVAGALTGRDVLSVEHVGGGGNSRIYKVTADGGEYALKLYPTIEKDKRDRLGTEKKALQFFAEHGLTCVPKWLAASNPFALLEWIDGELPGAPTENDIDKAVAFINTIFDLSKETPEGDMPLASEACLSGEEIMKQVEARFQRLSIPAAEDMMLAEFLSRVLMEMRRRGEAARQHYQAQKLDFAAPLPHEQRCLIPADFGFHNALKTPEEKLIFIDFEYFGWDDPVKLLCDFLLHPAMKLSSPLKRRFLEGTLPADKPRMRGRFTALYPLFGLRWTLILLNEFLPERWQARAFARNEDNWQEVKQRQLLKAHAMLNASAAYEV